MTDGSSLRLRPADMADVHRLLAWRNEPGTRAASRTQEEIGLATHRAWLEERLLDPDCALLVIEHDGRPVGQVRLDRSGRSVEVSIGLAPGARGCGVGIRALRAAESEADRWHAGELVAHVRVQNTASMRLFRAAGYRPSPARSTIVRFAKAL